MIEEYLEQLEELINVEHIRKAELLQTAAWNYEAIDRLPLIINYQTDGWPGFHYSESFYSKEKMLINELASVYTGAKLKDSRIYAIRANYGVGRIPFLFGCQKYEKLYQLSMYIYDTQGPAV